MGSSEILASLDEEIARLEQARAALAGLGVVKGSRRPKNAKSKKAAAPLLSSTTKKRTMSAEGRAKIAAAQKARWAAQKKATAAAAKSAKKA